jgi:predicted alpha/beta-fold hydrolase
VRWPHPFEDLIVDAGDDVRLLVRASWQPGPREDHPALVLIHGLGGFDGGSHVMCAGRLAWARGWHVLRMNMRGAGESEALCPRLYNAGLDTDLLAVLEAAAAQCPNVAVVGFSLGGALALLTAGRRAARLPSAALGFVGVSPPTDLGACTEAFGRFENKIYSTQILKELGDAYHRIQQRRPDLYAPGLERGIRTIREYDERITARYGGFRGAEHYYAESSSGPHLVRATRPTLVLAAPDDPLIPVESITKFPLSPTVTREITETGGHVGFVSRTEAPGWFWAAERALDFLEAARGAQ